jgi:hypothetical protein
MPQPISPDRQVNNLLERICTNMQELFHYSQADAWSLIGDYYRLFRDEAHCSRLGVAVQDDDFFFHEAPMGMALRIHYFLGMKEQARSASFLAWRKEFLTQLKVGQRGSAG